jgi:hypothetical protein
MNREHEAQERARAYFNSRRVLPPAAVREQIVAAFDVLEAVLAGVSPDQARLQPIPGEWSVQEVVDHLLETYRPGVDELRCLLAGRRPPGEPIRAGLQSKAPLLRPWPWLLGELHRTQERSSTSSPRCRRTSRPMLGCRSSWSSTCPAPMGPGGRWSGSRRSTGRPTRSLRGGCTRWTT